MGSVSVYHTDDSNYEVELYFLSINFLNMLLCFSNFFNTESSYLTFPFQTFNIHSPMHSISLSSDDANIDFLILCLQFARIFK